MVVYTLKVVEIIQETNDTKTICFKQPGLKRIKYHAGQYLTLIFRINGRRYLRPYSFSSSPATDKLIEITVKRFPNGVVSNHIHDSIKVGDSIEVLAPMGSFIYPPSGINHDQIFLWGVGSGITPLISLLKYVIVEFPDIKINLIYGNRSHETTIFGSLISDLCLQYSSRLNVWNFHTLLSVSKTNPYLIQGRITKEKVTEIMKEVNAVQSLHYICGPMGLKESVKSSLLNFQVPPSNILSEDFELVKDPKDFEDVKTESVRLKFQQHIYNLEIAKGKSILECALDAGIELPYSCQTGQCNLCKATLLNGILRMVGTYELEEGTLSNQYLLCCSHPLTNDVILDV